MATGIGVTEYGGPEKLHVLDLPAEPLGAGQLRLRITAAAVNPTNAGVRSGKRGGDRPADIADVPGMDTAGVVTEIGPDTDTGGR